MIFLDRTTAGHDLAQRLNYLKNKDVVVLGLPRGGVPVAFEVAKEIGAPLDVIVVRKLGSSLPTRTCDGRGRRRRGRNKK
jgi:putative phosphoribosyl transferase